MRRQESEFLLQKTAFSSVSITFLVTISVTHMLYRHTNVNTLCIISGSQHQRADDHPAPARLALNYVLCVDPVQLDLVKGIKFSRCEMSSLDFESDIKSDQDTRLIQRERFYMY